MKIKTEVESIISILHEQLVLVMRSAQSDNKSAINWHIYRYQHYLYSYIAQWRLFFKYGALVLAGPFKGLSLPIPRIIYKLDELVGIDGGSVILAPYMLGTYESEIHGFIEKAKVNEYDSIVDIGCSQGYYAVGLAKLFPTAIVHARDSNASVLEDVVQLSALNGVEDRVKTGGIWSGSDFSALKNKKSLIFVDIEGGEKALLDPLSFPALSGCDIIVEMHDVFDPSISTLLIERFSKTHHLEIVKNRSYSYRLPEESSLLTNWELSAVLDEFRAGPTPWAFMTAK